MEIQGKLFEIEPIIVPRPTLKTIDSTEIYSKIAKEIISWDRCDENQLAEIAESIKKEISLSDLINDSGYDLCKELESSLGYNPDDDLVEIMGGANSYIYEAMREAERKWVIDCWIKPKFNVGDKMEIEYKRNKYEGEIIKVNELDAKYVFFIPEVFTNKDSGTIKNFEEVELDFFKKNVDK